MSDPQTPNGQPEGTEPSEAEMAQAREQLQRVRAELAGTPVRDLVANHAIGLWQLALLHLGLDQSGSPPNLAEAKLAIDAMASLVDGVVDRLDDHAEPLKDALTTLRLAYVRVSEDASSDGGEHEPGSDRRDPAEP